MSNTQDNNPLDSHLLFGVQSTDEEPPEPNSRELSVPVTWHDDLSPALTDEVVRRAVKAALSHRGFALGEIGIYVTTDDEIQELNARHLNHDYPTDVISFSYEANRPEIHGELVVSMDTAKKCASQAGWDAEPELILYIVHGVLHITGMDDHDDDERAEMRVAEKAVLTDLGITDVERFGADHPLDPSVDHDSNDSNETEVSR